MSTNFLFPTPVFSMDAEDALLLLIQDEIAESLPTLRAACIGNPWGDNIDTTFNFSSINNIKTSNLINFEKLIFEACELYFTDLEIPESAYKFEIVNSWLNISKEHQFQCVHQHTGNSGCSISGVYYYQADGDEGDIQFVNPTEAILMDLFPSCVIEQNITFQPKTGRLLLFPSWLKHRVNVNKTKKERISFSFNIKLTPTPTT